MQRRRYAPVSNQRPREPLPDGRHARQQQQTRRGWMIEQTTRQGCCRIKFPDHAGGNAPDGGGHEPDHEARARPEAMWRGRARQAGLSPRKDNMTTFKDLGLDPKLLAAVEAAGFKTPSPIQAEAIPHALEGRDVLGLAQTGTGKTAAFGLPL